jgi:uncharacterized protein (TIGR03000 family)
MIHRAIALSAATLGLLAGSLAAQSPAPANPANEQSYESIAVQPAASVEASATGAAIGSNVYVTPHGRSDREVLINAQLPAQAELWIGNRRLNQTGPERVYISPPLPKDTTYYYDLYARWTENGAPIERRRRIFIRPGDVVRLNFLTESEAAAAASLPGDQAGTSVTWPWTGAETPARIAASTSARAPVIIVGGGMPPGFVGFGGGLPIVPFATTIGPNGLPVQTALTPTTTLLGPNGLPLQTATSGTTTLLGPNGLPVGTQVITGATGVPTQTQTGTITNPNIGALGTVPPQFVPGVTPNQIFLGPNPTGGTATLPNIATTPTFGVPGVVTHPVPGGRPGGGRLR